MKKYFFTGFITLLPLAVTAIIVWWVFDLLTAPFAGMVESLIHSYENYAGLSLEQHKTLVVFLSRIFALIFLLILIFVLGFVGRRFFFKLIDRVLSHIPLVRTIYRLSHDFTKAVFSDNKKTFKETILFPFPHKDALAIGFVTGDIPPAFKDKTGAELAIFVPTAPHPMSGFVLLTPKKFVTPIDVSVEDAFKFLISCGVIHPGEKSPSEKAEGT